MTYLMPEPAAVPPASITRGGGTGALVRSIDRLEELRGILVLP